MEQQEKQAIRSRRLRRAVACLRRKREGGEEEEDDGEDEAHPSPSKSKRERSANTEGDGENGEENSAAVAAGGFLGTGVIDKSPLVRLEDVSGTRQESLAPSTKTVPQGAGTSSSSEEDGDGGVDVATVTARPVFERGRRGRGAKTPRGRNKTGQRGRGKKL